MAMLANPAPTGLAAPGAPAPAWWRHGLVWMVIGGPLVVVIASMVTLWLALSRPDPVVEEDYYQKGININRTLEGDSLAPAVQARNHAATPGKAPLARRP